MDCLSAGERDDRVRAFEEQANVAGIVDVAKNGDTVGDDTARAAVDGLGKTLGL